MIPIFIVDERVYCGTHAKYLSTEGHTVSFQKGFGVGGEDEWVLRDRHGVYGDCNKIIWRLLLDNDFSFMSREEAIGIMLGIEA